VRERLYRSRTDRILFGVAGGFAEWLDQDPALVRIIWALLVLAGGAGFLLYIIAAIVIPEEPWEVSAAPPGAAMPGATDAAAGAGAPPTGTAALGTAPAGTPPAAPAGMTRDQARQARRAARQTSHRDRDGSAVLLFGALLVIVGGWFLLRDLIPGLDDRLFGPGLLIVIGVLLVGAAMRRQSSGPPH